MALLVSCRLCVVRAEEVRTRAGGARAEGQGGCSSLFVSLGSFSLVGEFGVRPVGVAGQAPGPGVGRREARSTRWERPALARPRSFVSFGGGRGGDGFFPSERALRSCPSLSLLSDALSCQATARQEGATPAAIGRFGYGCGCCCVWKTPARSGQGERTLLRRLSISRCCLSRSSAGGRRRDERDKVMVMVMVCVCCVKNRGQRAGPPLFFLLPPASPPPTLARARPVAGPATGV